MIARIVPVFVVVGFVALLAVGVWLLSGTPSSLVNEEPPELGPSGDDSGETVVVTVGDGDSASDVADELERTEAIESARLFRTLASLTGLSDDLVAGEYTFERGETALTALRRISQGVTSPLVVTIPEGLRTEEIGELLERRGVVSARDFGDALDGEYTGSFFDALPEGARLEGFLFPAKYGFSRDVTGEEAVGQLVASFDVRYREELLPRLSLDGRSLLDTVIIASIVEREARVAEERPIIASVFLNRIAQGIPLQADPTVQYAVAADPVSVEEFGFWKSPLTLADLGIESPYNTYVNVGLPPGPIANPGLDSLIATLEPADTNFLFFVARPDGSHVFAETLEEHQQNVCEIDSQRPECE